MLYVGKVARFVVRPLDKNLTQGKPKKSSLHLRDKIAKLATTALQRVKWACVTLGLGHRLDNIVSIWCHFVHLLFGVNNSLYLECGKAIGLCSKIHWLYRNSIPPHAPHLSSPTHTDQCEGKSNNPYKQHIMGEEALIQQWLDKLAVQNAYPQIWNVSITQLYTQ